MKRGTASETIKPITDNELSEQLNLEKKIAYLKDQLNDDHGSQTESDEDSDHVEEITPSKKNIKKQRQAVSAEVYGTFNKKEEFVPKVVDKSDETKTQ